MARSKSVCKTWNSITSSTRFMDYYHKNIRQVEGNLIIFFKHKYNYISGETNCYTLSPSNGNAIVHADLLEYYTWKHRGKNSVTPLGSCNGLVAILYNYKLILWNPLTKEHSFIRVKKGSIDNISWWSHEFIFGLCYDSSKDEYVMVVRFKYQRRSYFGNDDIDPEGNRFVKVYFYNFKYGQERQDYIRTEFRLLDTNLYQGGIGKVICGLLHWVIEYNDFVDPIVKKGIVCFDLKEEKFKKITQPDWSDDKTLLGLATLDGENQLGCVLHDVACENLEVWVMKEYGNSDSWSNLFTFPYMNMVDDCRSISYMNVYGFMPNGKLLVCLNDEKFWVYDIDQGNPMEMKSRYMNFDFAIVCDPTLISPPEPVVETSDETEDEYEYEYRYGYNYDYYYYDYNYKYGYDFDYDYNYDYYYYTYYGKWSRLRSRMGRKQCIICM
ncbi:F-box protein CPR1-like [Silene latifolia]|uniref:F-box protein CPR1-like n=1 Tax=Silene latifolia TaxID=37657 RepID=UPI003D778DA4